MNPLTKKRARPEDSDAWRRVQLARHPQRPHTLDYVQMLCGDFVELHGDHCFGDDRAVVGGPARLHGRTVMIVGHQKGRDTRENVERHFGMPRPEGYRKAQRLMRQAEKFGFPVLAFIDTPGADPGLGSEERGQAQAIAVSLELMARLRVPTVAVVIGEGGSGGALAFGLADRVLMLEYAIYSVASPEAAASILWRDATLAPLATEALRITAPELYDVGLVDGVIPEPPGGAHTDPAAAAALLDAALVASLAEIEARYGAGPACDVARLIADRRQKFRSVGVAAEGRPA